MFDFTELKSKLLDMMAWFHTFCQTHNLQYYALGGTMLGAVRHKGFIPWDDDIDIGMPRPDYDRLAVLMNDAAHPRYKLETPRTEARDYYYPFSKLYDTETTLIENTRCKIKRGIYLDIFPLDGFGNTLDESRENFQAIHKKHNLLLLKTAGIRKKRSKLKNLGVILFRFLPMNAKRILRSLDETCAKTDYRCSAYVGNPVGAWGQREIVKKEILGTPALYPFESISVYGPEKWDEYLTALYGNWREPPPAEKQVSHHDFLLIDLHKSYLES